VDHLFEQAVLDRAAVEGLHARAAQALAVAAQVHLTAASLRVEAGLLRRSKGARVIPWVARHARLPPQ
jgi:hypothetical protein